ncbi:uncharacterized protein LOC141660856 [Apium graveolens]|uniref:uncharacterized protein LOC141660856 n=1 Tax=Apium graveolens TaxID=4045 RepID=UPI003D79145A
MSNKKLIMIIGTSLKTKKNKNNDYMEIIKLLRRYLDNAEANLPKTQINKDDLDDDEQKKDYQNPFGSNPSQSSKPSGSKSGEKKKEDDKKDEENKRRSERRSKKLHGTTNPIEARIWLREIEKTFEIVGVEEDKKTIFVAFMLNREANYWWEAKRAIKENPIIPRERFIALFLEKYFPKHLEQQMKLKFLELKQGSMTIAEYENKLELSRFVPYHVDTEEKRTRHFQLGLPPWIQNRVAVLEISNYATLVHKASIVESGNDLYTKDKGGIKRKFSNNAGNFGRNFDGNKNKKPFVKREDRRMDRPRLGHQDNRGNEAKSSISENFMNKLGLELTSLEEDMMVEIANQEVIPVNRVCPNCTIEIQGKPFVVDLIPFKLGEFDVILGMDWLTRYDAQINCRLKRVSLKSLDNKKVILPGQKQTRQFLTMLQARRIPRQGCQAYLTHVIDTVKSTPRLEEIPVIKVFEDIFPENLPGLPPIEKSNSQSISLQG